MQKFSIGSVCRRLSVRAMILSSLAVLPTFAVAQEATITVPDVTAEIGQPFELRIEVDTSAVPSGLHFLAVHVMGVDTQDKIVLEDWSLGEGLAAHIENSGQPPRCDVELFDEGFMGVMFLDVPFHSEDYGTEWMVLHYRTVAETPTRVQIHVAIDSDVGMFERTTEIDIIEEEISAIFLRGDVNLDRRCDIADPISILGSLFLGKGPLGCPDAADIDDDGRLTISDPVLVLRSLFLGGPAMFESCAPDLTSDALDCPTTSC